MIAFLLLGSNMKEKKANINLALSFIDKLPKTSVICVSSIHKTEPWGYKNQPHFLNACCKIETEISPHNLLLQLKNIEKIMGRKKGIRYGPRIIDIDILLYGEIVLNEKDLIIPHPHLVARKFALQCLSEIGGEFVHPLYKKTINELLCNEKRD